jgi:hypothetical protein
VTTPTVAVTINTEQAAGVAIANGIVRFTPTKVDVSGAGSAGAIVVEQPFDVQLDGNGVAVPGIVPNVNNQYQVEFFGGDRNRLGKPVLATIPNQACYLHDHLTTGPAVLSDAQRALNGAQAAQAAAQAVLTDPGFVAVKNDLPQLESLYGALAALNALASDLTNLNALAAALTALNALAADLTALNALANDQVNLDAVAGALAAINACANNLQAILNAPTYAAQAQAAQAGAAASDADATQQAANANSFALSAAAQAAQAYAFSLSAASAQQQDLSTITKQMHFSPNAILGTLFYDTGKDSNPAWVDQCQNASYMFETLNGTWLSPNLGGTGFPNELTARYVLANAAEGINWTINGALGVTPGAGGYISNNGTAGPALSVPSSNANSLSGAVDMTLAAKANLVSWAAPSSTEWFGYKVTGNNGYGLSLQSTGKLSLTWGNGAATLGASSTVSLTQGANTDLWVAARLQCNVAGSFIVTFWTSADGVTWTQLGAAVSGAATTVAAAASALFLGANSAGNQPINGKLYAFQVLLNGLPGTGTVVTKFDGSAITANATGSYYQSAVDGKHYSLNAGAGVTQTTNGNSNKPPRVMAFVWEAGYFCIYDPTKPGCPLWKSWLCTATTTALGAVGVATLVASGVWAKEGKLWIGSNQGLLRVDFANDRMLLGRTGVYTLTDSRVAARNAQPSAAVNLGVNGIDGWVLGSNTTNCISGCVYPDAPVDQNTGLMQPTVFVGATVPTVIKDDGTTVTTTAMGTSVSFAALTPWYLLAANGAGQGVFFTLGSLRTVTANWAVATWSPNSNQFTADAAVGLLACNRSFVAKFNNGPSPQGPALSLMRLNASNPLASLFARITPYSNTGWMVGDIRGCWLSSTVSGTTVAGTNVVTDATFDNPATSASYFNQDGNISHSVSAGVLNVSTNVAAGSTYVVYVAATEPGVQYTINANFAIVATCTGGYFDVRDGASPGTGGQLNAGAGNSSTGTAAAGALSSTFVAISTMTAIRLVMVKTQPDASCTWDNHTCTATGIADRSYKANNLTLTGSLTKSAANAATQIMLYSGWSAANYAQQAYSANLDPGTGGVTESIWGTIPANVATAGTAVDRSAAAGAYYTFGHDATGKLTATVFDGTTARTVTTAASYATGQLFKARMILSPSGTLSISVNGAPVASTPGAPLLSLNNAAAVLTVGNRRALDQPWAGGLALVRIGTTIPTLEQSALCYEQEYMMFQPGAVCALADATALQDLRYDASQQKFKAVSSGYENSLVGLTFSAQAACSAGTFSHCDHLGGMKLLARATTNPGVDIMVPAYALREELANRDRAAAERARLTQPFDFSGGFTATETNGSSGLTGVSGWTYPSQANQRGVGASGTNVPANTVLTDYSGTTATLSAAATGAGAQQISLKGFRLPPGIEALDVYAGPVGSMSPKMEGVSNDYTRSFDGFCETVLMTPGYNAQVRINGRRWQQ